MYFCLSSPHFCSLSALCLHSFSPCYSPFLPTLWHPRWLCFLPALSALVVNIFPLLLSQHHDALKAVVPPFILSRTLCVKRLTIVTTLPPLIQSPSPFVALQSLEIRLFYLLLYFIHLLPSRLNHFHFTVYLEVPLCSHWFSLILYPPQFFCFSQSLSVSASPDPPRPCIYEDGD